MKKDTLVDYALGLDLKNSRSLEECIVLLQKLQTLCGNDYQHIVKGIEDESFKDFYVDVLCVTKLTCKEDVLINELVANIQPTGAAITRS